MIAIVAMIQQEVRWLSISLKHPDVSKIKQSNVEFLLLKTSNCLHVRTRQTGNFPSVFLKELRWRF